MHGLRFRIEAGRIQSPGSSWPASVAAIHARGARGNCLVSSCVWVPATSPEMTGRRRCRQYPPPAPTTGTLKLTRGITYVIFGCEGKAARMFGQALGSVFTDAATPQRIVLAILTAAIFLAPLLALLSRSNTGPWRRLLSDLRIAGPALGLLVGAMNSFHMAQTIRKLPFDATAKQLAPGVLEVSTLIAMGGLVGLVAIGALAAADATVRRLQTP